ncbi:MAG: hypothetical protein OXH06_07030 [Gemmatimonadetes bacterium]|nr:hypothetical protein [Gemmatimonadota bacterium]MDE3256848.1 hypothetical protein [Gemmatimonadota bacterium]
MVKAAIDGTQESGDRTGLRDELRESSEDFEEDINAVLTDEQKQKLDEMKAGGRKRSGRDTVAKVETDRMPKNLDVTRASVYFQVEFSR